MKKLLAVLVLVVAYFFVIGCLYDNLTDTLIAGVHIALITVCIVGACSVVMWAMIVLFD